MPHLPHQRLQRRHTPSKSRLLRAHANLEVTLQITRAVQRHAQKVEGFRAVSAALARVSLREPAKFDQFGLGRLEREVELPQPVAQDLLDAKGIRTILEADHKVVDIAN